MRNARQIMSVTELKDPTSRYPKPPYKRQSQPWPGLAGKMDPRPDHGETSYKGSGRLKGKKALITGGDSGMGRAAAIAFAREGADVAINYFPTEEPDAQEVIALITAERRTGIAIPGDIREERFCQELVKRAVEGLGGLDIVVSNGARQQSRESIIGVSSEGFDATMKTNIYAPFWIIKAALPHLKPGSVIIGTASEQAYDPSPELYDYAQTKAATMNYVKSLAKQLGPKGIRVNAVAPGPIWTPLQVSGGASMESSRSSAAIRRWAVPVSPRSSARSMCSWPPRMQASRPAKSTVPRVVRASRDCGASASDCGLWQRGMLGFHLPDGGHRGDGRGNAERHG
jgi:NAD(P)-dependent dehydrogenase (short-subunit alcohol dehydrogenase family)